ncbi:unnamed protein product [Cuscuta campestris]|uniref:DNA-directed RNA polymerases I and III subunit RPAC1 n=2 Tax=Cuscuta sect. Cleistogrammica TaxID=1824901 RepID=A0A484M1K6_9ASTE|nr:hypothetical protein DM860_000498 [Cuscuta australis]VFQ82489.1 unnamed protein product [Cuscuta campestris]
MSSSSSESETETAPTILAKCSVWDLPDVPQGQLPSHIELQRTRVLCTYIAPTNTEKIKYGGAFASMGVDNSVPSEKFRNNFRVEIMSLDDDTMEFDMVGIDAAVANAFRRILIAEVPTMAIEKVLIANNTSIVQDEVLSHRLGLIPLKVDPRLFEYMSENDTPNEKNTIVFSLHVRCERAKMGRISVKSGDLKWLPDGSEFELATEKSASSSTSKPRTYTSFSCSQKSLPEFSNNPIAPTHHDITIARLGPGQEIELEAHAVKGIGKTHAKWSPVATAWYRMLPEIVLLREIEDNEAVELVKKCPVKVFDIEDIGKGKKRATVARPRACTLCRECIREEGWEKNVALRRVKDHFIFTIESTGGLPPEVLFNEAVKILENKCESVITVLS